jgi:hypothetical protein
LRRSELVVVEADTLTVQASIAPLRQRKSFTRLQSVKCVAAGVPTNSFIADIDIFLDAGAFAPWASMARSPSKDFCRYDAW